MMNACDHSLMLGSFGGFHFRGAGSCGPVSTQEGDTPRWVLVCILCFILLALGCFCLALLVSPQINDILISTIFKYLFFSLSGATLFSACILTCCFMGED